jgi:hypothetical protein
MPHFIARIVTIGGILAVIAGLVLVSCTAARAHEWYPLACCNQADCYETGEGKREPDPVYTPQGWRLHDGVIVRVWFPKYGARRDRDTLRRVVTGPFSCIIGRTSWLKI